MADTIEGSPNITKDQKYRVKNLAVIREKDRIQAACRHRVAKEARQSLPSPRSPSPSCTSADGSITCPPPRPKSAAAITASAVEIVQEVREMVWAWTQEHGPVSGWPSVITAQFNDTSRNGTVEMFAQEWKSHCRVGRVLVKSLHDFTGSILPVDERGLRDILRQAFDLLMALLEGIAIIEAHLKIFLHTSQIRDVI